MNKKDIYSIYILLALVFIFLLILNEYLFGHVLYCDSNTSDLSEAFNHVHKSKEDICSNTNINCFTAFTHYKEIARRKILWYTCYNNNKGNFNSYKNFKESWDPNTKVFDEIKNELRTEIKDEFHKIFLVKRIVNWFLKPSNPSGGRGL